MKHQPPSPPPQPSPPSPPSLPFPPFFGEILILSFFIIYEAVKSVISNRAANVANDVFAMLEGDKKLEEIGEHILTLFRADRVIISTFTNGEKTTTGLHFYKLKIRSESLRGATASICDIMGTDLIPVKNFKTEFALLIRDKEMFISRRELKKLPNACQRHLRRINVKSLFQVMVFSDGTPIGLVTVHYESRCTADIISIKETNVYFSYISRVREILKKSKRKWFR